MTGDFDSLMVAHAKARGPVRVTAEGRADRIGTLIAWRPTYRGRRTYAAAVRFSPEYGPLTLNLKRYDVEPL